MTPPYLCSARRSRGRAEQIGQDSQTSPLWLWSRSNSPPFPEALSAMTQGSHYHHNHRPPFRQPATQKVLLTSDGVCVFAWTDAHLSLCVWIRSVRTNKSKRRGCAGPESQECERVKKMISVAPRLNRSHRSSERPPGDEWNCVNFGSQHEKNPTTDGTAKPLRSSRAPAHTSRVSYYSLLKYSDMFAGVTTVDNSVCDATICGALCCTGGSGDSTSNWPVCTVAVNLRKKRHQQLQDGKSRKCH